MLLSCIFLPSYVREQMKHALFNRYKIPKSSEIKLTGIIHLLKSTSEAILNEKQIVIFIIFS